MCGTCQDGVRDRRRGVAKPKKELVSSLTIPAALRISLLVQPSRCGYGDLEHDGAGACGPLDPPATAIGTSNPTVALKAQTRNQGQARQRHRQPSRETG